MDVYDDLIRFKERTGHESVNFKNNASRSSGTVVSGYALFRNIKKNEDTSNTASTDSIDHCECGKPSVFLGASPVQPIDIAVHSNTGTSGMEMAASEKVTIIGSVSKVAISQNATDKASSVFDMRSSNSNEAEDDLSSSYLTKKAASCL